MTVMSVKQRRFFAGVFVVLGLAADFWVIAKPGDGSNFWIATVGTLLLLLGIPSALGIGRPALPGHQWGAWYALLSEPGGGYSLSRVQMFVWFVPAIVLFAGASLAAHAFAPLPTYLAAIFGLSGVTTLLGAATSPSTVANNPTPPDPRDMLQDWNQQDDISRYQYLLLSIVGSLILIASFLEAKAFPATIPPQWLWLIGASQATYLGTKVAKS